MSSVNKKDISQAWLMLIISLPTQNATLRMRIWRTLKGMGCVALRDGVYLLPESTEHKVSFSNLAEEIKRAGGSACILKVESEQGGDFKTLFDRSAEYASLKGGIFKFRTSLKDIEHAAIGRLIKGLRRDFNAIAKVDFFPGETKIQAEAALTDAEAEAAALVCITPDGQHIGSISITQLDHAAYQGRLWATRRHPWIDRLASAWLIQRFIDSDAKFLWLEKPEDCPDGAVGFDFSGAAFSHMGNHVTFETLVLSFGLGSDAGLMRLAGLVHFLDVGGISVKEASGLETILLGAKRKCADDDSLLAEAMITFDYLYAAYQEK